MSRIGIVTVTFNSASVLPDFIRCLKSQDCQTFTLYVVDNRSTDGSADSIRKLCLDQGIDHRVIENPANVGIACANNQGIRNALGEGCDPVIVANNDIEFGPGALSEVIAIGHDRPLDLLAPKVVFHDLPGTIWCAGGTLSWLRGVPRTAGYRQLDGPRFALSRYTHYASTCFLVVPARVFQAVGLMDEDYFVYLDDSDFVARALQARFRIFYTPEPVIRHKVSVSTGGAESPFTIHQISKNTILFLHKNNPPPVAAWYILTFLARSALHLFRYNQAQRTNLFAGLRDGLRFVAQHRLARHNFPLS